MKINYFHSYELIGNSKNISNIRDQIEKISITESRVLINGPSGSGKELIARKIHKKSKRNNKPFIILNGALLDKINMNLNYLVKKRKWFYFLWCIRKSKSRNITY